MPLRPCLGCGLVGPWPRRPHRGYRCPGCRRANDRARRPGYDGPEARRRARAVEAWVRANGWVCPGYRVPAHPARDLTADHVRPTARGGPPDGELAVLCRGCNGRKADTAP